jgi:hypothetical protein
LLSDAFEVYLDKKFNGNLYEQLLKSGVIVYNRKDYLMKLAEEVNKNKGIGYVGTEYGKAKFENFICYSFLLIPYILNLDFDLPELKVLKNLSPFECWLASPFDFDYDNFKPEWLKAAQSTFILNRFKGNEKIKIALSEELKTNFDKSLAKVYFKYFV